MVGHYLVGALRAFRHRKAATLINILCLALGLAAFIVAYSVVRYLQTSERHFVNAERTYIISTELDFNNERPLLNSLLTAEHAARYVKEEFPELEAVTRAFAMGDTVIAAGAETAYAAGIAADPNFLDVFNLDFLSGNPSDALTKPRSVLITDALALRMFGSTSVLGKQVKIEGLTDVTITGVIGPPPRSSHFDFEMLMTWDVLETNRAVRRRAPPRSAPEHWLAITATTYALLPRQGLPKAREALLSRLPDFAGKYVPDDQKGLYGVGFNAVPLDSLQIAKLDQMLFANIGREVSIATLLFWLGALVLGLACINYANLAIAQAATTFKEIGTRRVVGATSRDLLLQSLLQTTVYATIALIAAICFVLAISPLVDQALDVEIRKIAFSDGWLWLFIPTLLLVVTAAGGVYVAMVCSDVAPSRALGNSTQASRRVSRAMIAGLQFAAACLLIVVVTVMQRQAQAIKAIAVGTQDDSIVLIGNNLNRARVGFDAYKALHAAIPGVQEVSAGTFLPWASPEVVNFSSGPSIEAPRLAINIYGIEEDFFAALDIPLVAGRYLSTEHGSDLREVGAASTQTAEPVSIVIDRALAESLGLANPDEAIGRLLYDPPSFPGEPGAIWQPSRIVGVVENRPFRVQGYGAIGSVYALVPRPWTPMLRVSPQSLPRTLEEIEDAWRQLAPNTPLDVRFLDATFDQGFRQFTMLFNFVTGLAILAVGIAVAGLIALATHEVHQRFHEIAIRKTLGAPAATVAAHLLRGFSLPVLIGNLVALPIAYLAAQAYLSLFTFRIDLTVWPFLGAVAATMTIGWLAVGYQVLRAARLDPATVLRYE